MKIINLSKFTAHLYVRCLGIVIILFDFFFADVFFLENIYVIYFTVLMLAGCFELLFLKSKVFFWVVNLAILGTLFFQIFSLLLMLLHFGFLGMVLPKIWILAVIVNLALMILAVEDLHTRQMRTVENE